MVGWQQRGNKEEVEVGDSDIDDVELLEEVDGMLVPMPPS